MTALYSNTHPELPLFCRIRKSDRDPTACVVPTPNKPAMQTFDDVFRL